jgi:hypothetical protein
MESARMTAARAKLVKRLHANARERKTLPSLRDGAE